MGHALQAQRSLEAPSQVHRRLMQRSMVAPHGGWGGRRQDRRFLYSRYRHACLLPCILIIFAFHSEQSSGQYAEILCLMQDWLHANQRSALKACTEGRTQHMTMHKILEVLSRALIITED